MYMQQCARMCICIRRQWPCSDLLDGDRRRKNHCNADARMRSTSFSMSLQSSPPCPPSSMLEETKSRMIRRRRHVFGPPTRTESSIATLCHVRLVTLTSTLNLRGAGSVARCVCCLGLCDDVQCIVAMNIPSTVSPERSSTSEWLSPPA